MGIAAARELLVNKEAVAAAPLACKKVLRLMQCHYTGFLLQTDYRKRMLESGSPSCATGQECDGIGGHIPSGSVSCIRKNFARFFAETNELMTKKQAKFVHPSP
jgi:hypothetical protein